MYGSVHARVCIRACVVCVCVWCISVSVCVYVCMCVCACVREILNHPDSEPQYWSDIVPVYQYTPTLPDILYHKTNFAHTKK